MVEELFNGLKLRWDCKQLGFEKLSLKGGKLRCYFIGNAQSSYFESKNFQKILQYVAGPGMKKGFSMKQTANFLILIKEQVPTFEKAHILLQDLITFINNED